MELLSVLSVEGIHKEMSNDTCKLNGTGGGIETGATTFSASCDSCVVNNNDKSPVTGIVSPKAPTEDSPQDISPNRPVYAFVFVLALVVTAVVISCSRRPPTGSIASAGWIPQRIIVAANSRVAAAAAVLAVSLIPNNRVVAVVLGPTPLLLQKMYLCRCIITIVA
jgi:hypothetical protein